MAKRLWDLFTDDTDAQVYRLHLGGKVFDPVAVAGSGEDTVEMQWTDYHWGDESRPE